MIAIVSIYYKLSLRVDNSSLMIFDNDTLPIVTVVIRDVVRTLSSDTNMQTLLRRFTISRKSGRHGLIIYQTSNKSRVTIMKCLCTANHRGS